MNKENNKVLDGIVELIRHKGHKKGLKPLADDLESKTKDNRV